MCSLVSLSFVVEVLAMTLMSDVSSHPSNSSSRDIHLLRKGFPSLALVSPFSVSSWTSSLAVISSLGSHSIDWTLETFSLCFPCLLWLAHHLFLVGAKLACVEKRVEHELSKNNIPNILGCLKKQSLVLDMFDWILYSQHLQYPSRHQDVVNWEHSSSLRDLWCYYSPWP